MWTSSVDDRYRFALGYPLAGHAALLLLIEGAGSVNTAVVAWAAVLFPIGTFVVYHLSVKSRWLPISLLGAAFLIALTTLTADEAYRTMVVVTCPFLALFIMTSTSAEEQRRKALRDEDEIDGIPA
jgi:hypothetical protein